MKINNQFENVQKNSTGDCGSLSTKAPNTEGPRKETKYTVKCSKTEIRNLMF